MVRTVAIGGAMSSAMLFALSDVTIAQDASSSRSCLDFRALDTTPLVEAAESKRKGAIAEALITLAKLPRFAPPKDPTVGRRPVPASYQLRFTDRQIERRARNLFDVLSGRTEWRSASDNGRRLRTLRFERMASGMRTLLVLAEAFPQYEKEAQGLARDMADAILAASKNSESAGTPLAPAARVSRRNPFLQTTVRNAVRSCAALRASLVSGWLISHEVPEAHYRMTALIGEAMIALTRATGERRFVEWAQAASHHHAGHALVADVHANAMAVGLDAELYSVTANERYLERARERLVLGVLPSFNTERNAPQNIPFIKRLPLGDLADITRALMHAATAFAVAPTHIVSSDTRNDLERATRFAYTDLQERAIKARRLQFPAHLIELSFDVERAQRAGANITAPDAEAFRHALAHGADRVKRFIPLSGAASGLLLARLKARGWNGAYRTPKLLGGN